MIAGLKKLLLLAIIAGLGYGVYYYFFHEEPVVYGLTTSPITRGEIVSTVTATGELNAISVVEVGTQVSGTVQEIYVDFNSPVKKGQLLAEILGCAYYDREIISEISKRTSLSEKYIQNISEHKPVIPFPIHTGRTFWAVIPDYGQAVQKEQHDIIREISSKSDCVIVGRGADYILRDEKPFRVFVYSDMAAKISRCRQNISEDYGSAEMSDKELTRRIEQINKGRADYYEFYTGQKWGSKENYDLCVNTTRGNLKTIAEAISRICVM